MIKLLECSSTGVVQYCITKESEINELPKNNISIGSSTQLINASGLKVFMFTQEDKNIDGQWIEI